MAIQVAAEYLLNVTCFPLYVSCEVNSCLSGGICIVNQNKHVIKAAKLPSQGHSWLRETNETSQCKWF